MPILGMSVTTFTQFHVLLSLIGIAAGLVVAIGMLRDTHWPFWTAVFLASTAATSATGFLFHSKNFGPPHIVGLVSLVILAVAMMARYQGKLTGNWRWIYVATAIAALYLNVFVGVAQAFQKIPQLNALAPTGSGPVFAGTQLVVLALFIVLGVACVRGFHRVSGK